MKWPPAAHIMWQPKIWLFTRERVSYEGTSRTGQATRCWGEIERTNYIGENYYIYKRHQNRTGVARKRELARPFGKFGHFGISGIYNPYIRPPDPRRGSFLTIILLHSSTRISLTASLLNLDIARSRSRVVRNRVKTFNGCSTSSSCLHTSYSTHYWC